MLVIRQPQLDALRGQDDTQLEHRLLHALSAGYPDEVEALGLPATRSLIHHGVTTGRACGLETDAALAKLVELMVQLGEQFERSPDRARALARLHHPTMPGALKIELVEAALTARTQGRVVVRFGGSARTE